MARGHLRKRAEGSWTLIVELERDPATGKRRQKWTFRGVKRDADAELARLLVDAEKGQVGNAGRMTVGDFLDKWLAQHAAPNLSAKTHSAYGSLIANQIKPFLGRVQLEKLRAAQLLQWQAALRTAPLRGRRKGIVSATTQHHAHRVLHTALGHAVKWKLIAVNPASSVSAPSMKRAEMRAFDRDQAAAFLAAAPGNGLAWHAFFLVALTTGMRLAELIGLRWQDADLTAGVIRVRQTISHLPKKGTIVKAPKTAAGRRSISIGADVVALLRRHKAAQNKQRLQLGSAWQDQDLVFPSALGTALHEHVVRSAHRRICTVAEVPVVRVHDIRHTAATLMLLGGVNVKVVSERLGHASIAITLQTYAHVLPSMQQDAANVLEAMLKPRVAHA